MSESIIEHNTDHATDLNLIKKNDVPDCINISSIDRNIINLSTFLWKSIKEKYNQHPVIEMDFPFVIVKEINEVDNICCHFVFKKKHKITTGTFLIHSKMNHSHYYVDNSSIMNSFYVDKSIYFVNDFLKTKLVYTDFECINKFTYFCQKINNFFNNILLKLKFNIYYGKFEIPNSQDDIFIDSLTNIFKNSNNIKTIGDKCCVCHEETVTQTNCSHSLCVKCYIKIKKTSGISNEAKCPLCREFI